jgi:hypothetical protein
MNKNNKRACYFVFVHKIGSEYNGDQFILSGNQILKDWALFIIWFTLTSIISITTTIVVLHLE